jgi:tight adherence protein C
VPVYVVVAALALTLSVPVLLWSFAQGGAPTRRVNRNLNLGLAPGGDLRGLVLSQSPLDRIARPLVRVLARPAHRLSPSSMVATLERRRDLCGLTWPTERLLVLKLVLAAAVLAAGAAWASLSASGTALLVALAGSLAAYVAPDAMLARMARARQLAIQNQLPDTLDQLGICVEAGLGFDAALARTARSGRGPLAHEIARLLQELRVGVPRPEALDNLLARTEVPELRQFVHAIVHAETYGVPISNVLRAQALEQREKRRFRAEERAMKLPVKVIFPLVFCILPTLFIVVLGPAFVHVTSGLR